MTFRKIVAALLVLSLTIPEPVIAGSSFFSHGAKTHHIWVKPPPTWVKPKPTWTKPKPKWTVHKPVWIRPTPVWIRPGTRVDQTRHHLERTKPP